MAIKSMSEDLYKRLESIRNSRIDELITQLLLAKPTSTISEVIGLLKEHNTYQVFIAYKNKIVSINIRDILEYKNIDTAKPSLVGKVVPTLKRGDTIAHAAGLLTHYRLRALPVVEDSKVIGQINAIDIIKRLNNVELNVKASSLMSTNLITISEEDKGATAKNLIIKHKIDHLPIVEDTKPLAMLTSYHLMSVLSPPEKPDMMTTKQKGMLRTLPLNVKGLADKDVVAVDATSSIKYVIDTMLSNNSSYTLVKIGDELQGIITIRDLVMLAQEMIKDEIPAYIIGLPDDPIEAELAKSKFLAAIKLLRKTYTDILEARCRIKIKDVTGERKRYEVDMHIITPKENISYIDIGWDLANVFDNVSNALKRRLEKKDNKRRSSVRYASEYDYRGS
ncbi:MAG: CBS domain-containing protein [Candidatus Nitrosocaldaceae archaeon]